MEQIIKNMKEYNPRYTRRGALKWQKINTGKHPKKEFPMIAIEKIRLKINKPYKFFEDTYNRAKEQYEETHEFIPVNLRAEDLRLRSGYEFYVLAKELGLKEIPYILYRDASISHKPKPELQKTRAVIDCTGNTIYVSEQAYQKIKQCILMCKTLGFSLKILPTYRFRILDEEGKSIRAKEFTLPSVYKRLKTLTTATEEQKKENNSRIVR